jgi:hypothetical protein
MDAIQKAGSGQAEDHRELGDLWKPDHLAVATLRRTVFRFER